MRCLSRFALIHISAFIWTSLSKEIANTVTLLESDLAVYNIVKCQNFNYRNICYERELITNLSGFLKYKLLFVDHKMGCVSLRATTEQDILGPEGCI